MEYSYIDIEASIRHAQALRAQAMADFLSAVCTKSVHWFKVLVQHKVKQVAVATRSSPTPLY